jgi:hypothetical protein
VPSLDICLIYASRILPRILIPTSFLNISICLTRRNDSDRHLRLMKIAYSFLFKSVAKKDIKVNNQLGKAAIGIVFSRPDQSKNERGWN